MRQIGLRIAAIRKAQKMTQRALAERLGEHVATIKSYEHDRISPPMARIELV